MPDLIENRGSRIEDRDSDCHFSIFDSRSSILFNRDSAALAAWVAVAFSGAFGELFQALPGLRAGHGFQHTDGAQLPAGARLRECPNR